ncbi:TOBE domain-containing protein, partial [Streptomyces sp. NPDC003832]
TVFVTHDQDEALSFSDRIAVMNQGRVLQVGTPDEIYNHPADLFVADFVGTANVLDATVVEADGARALIRVEGIGTPLSVPHTDRRTGPVKVSVRPENIGILRGHDDNAPAGLLTAKVENRAYLGDHYRYTIRIGGTPAVVTTTRPVGEGEITIGLTPEDIRVFHEEPLSHEENKHAPVN